LNLSHILPIATTVITLIFAGSVFSRWLDKPRPHLFYWFMGLVFYGLGAFSESILGFGFNPVILKLWYLCGAMLTAAWLGQGTIFLLIRKGNRASYLAGALLVISIFSFELIRNTGISAVALEYDVAVSASLQYKDILVRSGLVRLLTVLLNIYGTLGLVGGALYSAFLFWRKQVLADRMIGNLLIAVGALFPALGGTFIPFDLPDWLFVSEFLGAIFMYLGFLRTIR
jgi:hypothetical protein